MYKRFQNLLFIIKIINIIKEKLFILIKILNIMNKSFIKKK